MRTPLTLLTLLWAACSAVGSDSHDAGPVDAGLPAIVERACVHAGADAPDSLPTLGCRDDFDVLASQPLDQALPGARSVKVVLDTANGDALHFQNSVRYAIHYAFVSKHLSGNGLPIVPPLGDFNATEYFSPERRFVLGAVTFYEGPQRWTLELSPYDTASAALITRLFEAVRAAAWFGPALAFHPTSDTVAAEASNLPPSIRIATTDELHGGVDYQPLTLGTTIGRLSFMKAAALASTYVPYSELLVLDEAPNDLGIVRGLITAQFQTPLSHVNVLSRNRGTPNMGLRGAFSHPQLRALEGRRVRLEVGAAEWSVREATEAEETAFWEQHKPAPVTLPPLDLSVTELVDAEDATPEPSAGETLRDAIRKSVRAFGGKTAQYSVLARTKDVPVRKAFAVPVAFYDQFLGDNGFKARIAALLADAAFRADPAVRDRELARLRADMLAAPVPTALQDKLRAKIASDYAGAVKLRFRTSTNSEDLEGFPCAGCYESHSAKIADWQDVLDAIRETYASAWLFRTFEERAYYGVAHDAVGMALLVHRNFPDEEANGVAVTANPFDASGLDPAFYVNVQRGGQAEVVAPPPGVTSDQLLYYFASPNRPVTYLARSNLVPAGSSVLTSAQLFALGKALAAIHARFSPAYGPASGNNGWYAMDVEFKFDDDDAPGQPATLHVKQARPYPGSSR